MISAGTISIGIDADLSRLASQMQEAKRMVGGGVSDFERLLGMTRKQIDDVAAAERARAQTFSQGIGESTSLLNIMRAAAQNTAKTLQDMRLNPSAVIVPDAAFKSLDNYREKAAYAIGAGSMIAVDKAKQAWDGLTSWVERQVAVFGVALVLGVSAAAVGAVYLAYRTAKAAIGLITGESYDSKNVQALIALNDQVKTLQTNLPLTAVGASALNEALKVQGTTASEYVGTIGKVNAAQRTNGEELDRLGVKYQDQRGGLLSTDETMKNALVVIQSYAEGWDRTQAAQAIAMGSEKELADAVAISAEKTKAAKDRLIDYNLVIGPGTQAAIKSYQDSMRAFNREADLTSLGFKASIARNIMPILTDLSQFFQEGFPTAVKVFDVTMASITSAFLFTKTAIFGVLETILGGIQAVASGLIGVAGAIGAAMRGDVGGAKAALLDGWDAAKMRLAEIGKAIELQAKHNADAIRLAWATDTRTAGSAPNTRTPTGKPWVPKPEETDETEKANTELERLMKTIAEKTAIEQAELDGVAKLTDAEQLALKAMVDLRDGRITATEAERIDLGVKLEQLLALDKEKVARAQQIIANKALVETIEQRMRAEQQADDALAALNQTYSQARQDADFDAKIRGMEVDALRTLGPQYGELSKRTLDYAVAKETEIALRKLNVDEMREEQRINGLGLDDFQRAEKLEELYKRIAEEKAGAPARARAKLAADAELADATKLANAEQELQVSMWQAAGSTAHDVFDAIFSHGKDTFTKLRDSLKTTLLALLEKMTLQPFLIQVVTTAAGAGVAERVFGAAATAQNAGGGAGGLGALNNLPFSQLFGGGGNLVGGLAGIGNAVFSGSGALANFGASIIGQSSLASTGALGAGTLASELGTASGSAASGVTSAASLAGSAASYLPYVGALIQLATGNVKGAIGTAAGAAIGSFFGPIGTAVGAVIGSLASSLFGNHGIPSRAIDSGGIFYNPEGVQQWSRGSQGAMDVANGISKGIVEAAAALGAKLTPYQIGFGSNTGKDSKDPNFDLSASVGATLEAQRNVFHSGEDTGQFNKLDQDTIALRSAQAMIAVLREADMPKYLADFFKALKPVSEMTKADVDATLQYVQQLKTAHEVLEKIADISGLKATADDLIAMFGNIQTAAPLLQSYYDNFFSASEQQAEGLKQVTAAMIDLGVGTIPATREEFRKLVEAQDLTTDAGKAMFQSLIAIAPAFSAVTDALNDAVDSLTTMQSDLVDGIAEQISASQDAARAAHSNADAYRAAGKSMQDAIRALRQGDLSTLLPGQKLAESRTGLDDIFQKALSGDKSALGALPQAAQDFLQASRAYNASSQAYSADFQRVMQMLKDAGIASDTFAGVSDYQATLLQAQTGVLEQIRDELKLPDPSLETLQQAASLLTGIQTLLQDQSHSLLTINSSVLDQTGQVISGNSLISGQTGEIVALPRLIGQQNFAVTDQQLSVVNGSVIGGTSVIGGAVADQSRILNGTLNVNDPAVLAQAQQLLSASGPLAQGQYAIQDETGRVYAATVDQTGMVSALNDITRGQAGTIALGNALLDAQTHQIIIGNTVLNTTTGQIVQGVDQQTGKVVAGNSTSDAIRNLTALNTNYTQDTLQALITGTQDQTDSFVTMIGGLDSVASKLTELIAVMKQRADEAEAARLAAEAAAKAAQEKAAGLDAARLASKTYGDAFMQWLTTGGYTDRAGASHTGMPDYANAGAEFAANADFFKAVDFIQKNSTSQTEIQKALASANYAIATLAQAQAEYASTGTFHDRFGYLNTGSGPRADQFVDDASFQALLALYHSLLPSHASGLAYVPYDNYLANLHQGEAVLRSSDAAVWRGASARSGGGYNSADADRICASLDALRQEVRNSSERASDRNVHAIEKQTGGFADVALRASRDQTHRHQNRSDANVSKSR